MLMSSCFGEQPWCNDVNRVPAVSGAKSHRCGNTNKQGCFLVASTEQHWCSEREQGPRLWCCASLLNCSRAVRGAKLIGVTAPDKQGLFSSFTHQSLGSCSRSLHQCCSVKQDENSLACRCSHTYKFGTLHSSAAIQQRCAAPKPGTLFTLTAPLLLCEAR